MKRLISIKFPTSPVDRLRWVLGAAVVGLVYYGYWGQKAGLGESAYEWLTGHWSDVSYYSHGPLIPLIAVWLAWWKRDELFAQPVVPTRNGWMVVAVAMALYYIGMKGGQPHTVVISFVVLLYGLVLSLAGRAVFGVLFFPITFLFLMIPLNFLEERIGLPLRHLMAWASTVVLNVAGVETVKIGTQIVSHSFHLDVEKPCSGIRSLMALTTVTAAYGYVTQQAQWKRWVVFLSAIPLAVLGNMVRVVLIALVAQNYGQKVAMDLHDSVAGYVVFGVALVAMVVFGMMLNVPYRQIWEKWTRPVASSGGLAETKHE